MVKAYSNTYHFVRGYDFKDPETGETDHLVFSANAYLFPLFKSYTGGLELGDAIAEYKASLPKTVTKDTLKAVKAVAGAETKAAQIQAVEDNTAAMEEFVKSGMEIATLDNGLNLLEVLPIVMHAASMPLSEQMETLALGIESLPLEVFKDQLFCVELLKLVFDYDGYIKKKSLYTPKGRKCR